MADQIFLTPYFLDQPLQGLEDLLEVGWSSIRRDLTEGSVLARVAQLHQDLAAAIESCLRAGNRPVSIAGDCLSAIAVTAGIQRAGIEHALIWFDAHGDFNTWETSPSGFLGGMPLAMLVGRGEQTLLESLEMQAHPEERVIFTDGRDLDPLEREAMAGSKMVHLKAVDELLYFELPDLPLHIHFDTDILDPGVAPAMNYLAAGGPDLERLQAVFQRLARSKRIAAISLSSWNPELDPDDRTRAVCMEALDVLLQP